MSYYDTLQVDKKANKNRIRRNYLTLGEKFHPRHHLDRKKDAVDAFKTLSEAFDVLSNEMMRGIYDDRGYSGLNDALHSSLIPHPLTGHGHFIDDFAFRDFDKSHYTLSRSESLFDEASKKSTDTGDDMLDKGDLMNPMLDDDFDSFFKRFGDKDSQMTGKSFSQSTMIKGGKKFEVTKESVLNPDGTVDTRTHELRDDGKGHIENKDFSDKKSLNSGQAQQRISNH